MDFYVDYFCENDKETGRIKLCVSDFDTKSVKDLKYAIQDAIQAPVCDQKLFYQGQPLTDDNMLLRRLYFREGDCFYVQFLAVADIPQLNELMGVLKVAAQEIVENLQGELPGIEDCDSNGLWKFHQRLVYAVKVLDSKFLNSRKALRMAAQKHYFLQEGGFDAFLEVLKFSRNLFCFQHPGNITDNRKLLEDIVIVNHLIHHFNQGQLTLHQWCLRFLWAFHETTEDCKFILSKGVLPLAINALLVHPRLPDDAVSYDMARMIIAVNEAALGCCAGLVEDDSTTQKEVSQLKPLIAKILFMVDRCRSEPAGYSVASSQLAACFLFYCTFNIKSAQSLVDCGALTKMIDITRQLLLNKEGNIPQRFYCCLFLARIQSAPLIKLDRDSSVVIDELIDTFLEKHIPSEISKWEEKVFNVWSTLIPLAHLAFAAGKEYCRENQTDDIDHGNYPHTNGANCSILQGKEESFLENNQSTSTPTQVKCSSSDNVSDSGSSDSSPSCEDVAQIMEKCKLHEDPQADSPLDSNKIHDALETCGASKTKTQGYVIAPSGENFTWPGTRSTQKLGIFSLVSELSMKANQQVALSENLVPYLLCLSWHLDPNDKEKFSTSLANFQMNSPPSLKIAAKSVLARVNGLDMVLNL